MNLSLSLSLSQSRFTKFRLSRFSLSVNFNELIAYHNFSFVTLNNIIFKLNFKVVVNSGKVHVRSDNKDERDWRGQRHSPQQSDVWGRTVDLETKCRQRIFAASTGRRHSKDHSRHWKDQSSPWSETFYNYFFFIFQWNLNLTQNFSEISWRRNPILR